MGEASKPPLRPITSYVRRSTRMNDSQRTAWQRLSSQYLLGGLERDAMASRFVEQAALDLNALFAREAPLLVEVGAGSGENLAVEAIARPDWNLLGFEVYDKVLGSTMSRLDRAGAANVRLVHGDAVTGFEYLIPPQTIGELQSYFPDPWHKTRHVKRRLINPGFVELAASRLNPEGLWRLATDWDDYAEHISAVFGASPLFEDVTADQAGLGRRPVTKFEARAKAAGRAVTEFVFRRVP